MAWFKKSKYTQLSAPKLRDRIPQDLMAKCDGCLETVLQEETRENLWVCPKCDYHTKLDAPRRIEITFDSFEEDNQGLESTDPLGFVSTKPYAEQLVTYRERTGRNDAVMTGAATIHGFRVSAAVMDFSFIGGSMGSVVGEKVTRACERSLEEEIPFITINSSGGARMQEGILSLMQMAKTGAAVGRLAEAGVPYLSVLTNPTTAGVMASYASLGDVILAEPGCMVGFAGPRVIQETIREILPKGFQTAEFVRDKGFIDMVVHRKDMRKTLADLLSFLSSQANPDYPGSPAAGAVDTLELI
jgi:acetyl-CoA carboxylase carboxyl transferase subunit beta